MLDLDGFGFELFFFGFFPYKIWMRIYGAGIMRIYLVKGLGEADHGVWDKGQFISC